MGVALTLVKWVGVYVTRKKIAIGMQYGKRDIQI